MGWDNPIPWDAFEKFHIPWDGMESTCNPMVWDGISSVSHGTSD